jgi:cell division protein FtsL
MWKKLYELLERVFTLTQRVTRHDAQIEDLRQEVRELSFIVSPPSRKRNAKTRGCGLKTEFCDLSRSN